MSIAIWMDFGTSATAARSVALSVRNTEVSCALSVFGLNDLRLKSI